MFKSGYVAIVGLPNVGKSTLLNAFLGQKIAAVTSKPQTTRHRILGIKHLKEGQILFLDTPGIHKPHKRLNEYMMEGVQEAIQDADLFLLMAEPDARRLPEHLDIYRRLAERNKPVIVAINKIDTVEKRGLLPLMAEYLKIGSRAVVPISALEGAGVIGLEGELLRNLPEGPPYYPSDQVSDRTERFFVSEIIREKVMDLVYQEVPYSVVVVVEDFREAPHRSSTHTYIRAAIVVEKDSQKGIVIGKGGSLIKKIGELARKEIESEMGTPVYLELFVKVEKDWPTDANKVKSLSNTN